MIYSLYRGLTTIMAPLISRYLQKRLHKGKEHPTRYAERLGQTNLRRPTGPLIWLHGASVGEAISLLPLINAMRRDYSDYHILLTTGTVTSAALMEKRLPDGVTHQFIPVDRLPYVRRFLDHWRPDVAIWAESELWPNLICETRKRGVSMALINARMSDKSLKTWQRVPGFAKKLLGAFDLCLAQTDEDAQRYRDLGAQNVQCPGNLKYASPDLPVDDAELAQLRNKIGKRPVWMAASTHDGEEVLIAQAHRRLKERLPDVLTIIAPRHPERGPSIAADLRAQSLSVAQRSIAEDLNPACDIYLADTMGELGLFYRLSPIVFMGKSLEPLGGQNPLEAARLNCALLCGPYMTNFAEIMARFAEQDSVMIVHDETEMVKAVTLLLSDEALREEKAQRALKVAVGEAAVLQRTLSALAPFIGGAGRGHV
ncbi:3-deoxy-D-manno-octulosonic acid transferase [Terasakiella brassicae]|uniref:3-deoxy-D-manno-octulosonic acid transferase n=1 Tax=Terasakiella brassicae TaxID=1634917 RepID=A0A917C4J5_9PROT|nr:3-deoxy-D-manno-octulosonic acid transferase [Terasakiella brassicae]GGF69718.1 3-deoxy-D-manno-octulosonic acid transferase [Terasakiella brassicae]